MSTLVNCPKCRVEIESDSYYCDQCGVELYMPSMPCVWKGETMHAMRSAVSIRCKSSGVTCASFDFFREFLGFFCESGSL